MAMRSVLSRGALTRSMQTTRGATRYFSDGKGRVRSEEERAADTCPSRSVWFPIKKEEKKWGEKMQKLKEEAEKQMAQKEKENAEKKPEGTHRG